MSLNETLNCAQRHMRGMETNAGRSFCVSAHHKSGTTLGARPTCSARWTCIGTDSLCSRRACDASLRHSALRPTSQIARYCCLHGRNMTTHRCGIVGRLPRIHKQSREGAPTLQHFTSGPFASLTHTRLLFRNMPSYAVIGGSRGIGLEFVRQLVCISASAYLHSACSLGICSPPTLRTLYS